MVNERTPFLWLVKTEDALPAARSQQRTVESAEHVMICREWEWGVNGPERRSCWWLGGEGEGLFLVILT